MDEQQDPNVQSEVEPYQFYNVMPKAASGDVVVPTVTVSEPEAVLVVKTPTGAQSLLQKYKWSLIALVGTLVLVTAGYFIYEHYLDLGNPSLSQNPPASPATTTTTTTTPPVSPVTTPTDWLTKYFGNAMCQDISVCGDSADPDRDGLTNLEEYKAGTDPNNPDSSGSGIADGDKVHVFLMNPLTNHNSKDVKYTDADNLKGGYNFATDQLYTQTELQALISRIVQFGLHEPTVKTLGDAAVSIYHFDGSSATGTPSSLINASSTPSGLATTTPTSSPTSGLDQSPQARADRDAQRTNTIQTIATVLLKYQNVVKTFPDTNNFAAMYAEIKPYNILATNPVDPVNKDPFVYAYVPDASGTDFTLSFYSETQNQLIKIHAADAQKYQNQQAASNNDDERKTDLESIQSALLLYSNANAAGNQNYVFPTQTKYKTALVPQYLSAIPLDPSTQKDYDYEVSSTFDTFTLKTILENPPTGSTGYMCNQLDCGYY